MNSGGEGREELQSLTGVDRVIHEPARLMILAHLYVVESGDFVFLMRQTGLTRGNLSSHMGKLEAVGYVEVQKEFVERIPRTLYRLTEDGRRAFQAYRENMKKVFEGLPA
jgi:DNA-binding MarR family transcriptional regulator